MNDLDTCAYCAEPIAPGVPRCPACGESVSKVPLSAAELGPERPIGPKLIAWFSLIFGVLGLFGPVVTAVLYTLTPATPNDPMRAAVDSSPAFRAWFYASQGLGLLLAVGLLASGVGLLGWREWARRLAIRVAAGHLVLLVVSTVTTGVVLGQSLGSNPATTGLPPGVVQGIAVGAMLFGACFGSILPVATLLVLRRPATAEVFAAHEAERAAR